MTDFLWLGLIAALALVGFGLIALLGSGGQGAGS